MSIDSAELILVDWGSTAFRAFLLGPQAQVLQQTRCDAGVLTTGRQDFPAVLEREIAPWIEVDPGLPILLCGMVGSRQGWVETAYAPCPASLEDIAARLVPAPDGWRGKAWIVPGLCVQSAGAADVMRGEEVQVFGALQMAGSLGLGAPELMILPGTHSKWAWLDHRKIIDFSTAITGEMFAQLSVGGCVGSLLVEDAPWLPSAFVAGLERSRLKGGLLHHLFTLRADIVTGRIPAVEGRSQLSGLLLGHEIAELGGLRPWQGPALLVGADHLLHPYSLALEWAGLPCHRLDGEAAVTAGGYALAAAAGLRS